MNQKEQEIQMIIKKQSQILKENYVDLIECQKIVLQKTMQLWNREIADYDFLRLRLGTGTLNTELTIEAPDKHFTLDDDDLHEQVYKLADKYRYLEHVPITISLVEDPINAVITNSTFNNAYIQGLLLQLMALHSPLDLRIVILTDTEKEKRWDYAIYAPHLFSEDGSMRFFATNLEESREICAFLEKEYLMRKESNQNITIEEEEDRKKNYVKFSPYYLIITDNYKGIRNLPFALEFLDNYQNYGFSFLIIDDNMKHLPKECEKFIYICDSESGIFTNELKLQDDVILTVSIPFYFLILPVFII